MDQSGDEKLAGSYALVSVHDREQRVGVMQTIAEIGQVISSSAVDGDYDIVLMIKELPGAGIEKFISNKIRTLKGVKAVEICRVELAVGGVGSSIQDGDSGKSDSSSAECYLFLETDKRHFEDIFSSLSVLSSVTSCEVASGQFSLVLRLEAGSFDTLEKIINEKIRPLPGVLRAKESRIIKLSGL
ncbi:MAG: Lrp/AsnC ligand binding domain-containing protein [Candidatus Zixiibacteriota bacterium]